MSTISSELQKEEYTIQPQKFVLWLIIVASIMLFAGFTSAYIVRRGDGNWEVFNLPTFFAINIGIALLASVTMQLSYRAAKKDEVKSLNIWLAATLILGTLFLLGQYIGWKELTANNVFFAFSNPSNSFVYVISGVHFAHVIAGVIFILVTYIKALQLKIHKTNLLLINMCTTFWHFLAAMWVYLYLFMLLNR